LTPNEFAKKWHEYVDMNESPNCFRFANTRNTKEIPVSLQDPVFAYFMKNYDKYSINEQDEINAEELIDNMCGYYQTEEEREAVFLNIAKKFLPNFIFFRQPKFVKKKKVLFFFNYH
jgi:hypothetical protein